MRWIMAMYFIASTKKYVIVVRNPVRGWRDRLSHTVLLYQLTHRCRGLQEIVALQCDKCILMDNSCQKRHFCSVYAPLCVLRYSYTQVCSRAIEVSWFLDRAVTFFFLHWQIRHLLALAGYVMKVPPPMDGRQRGNIWFFPVNYQLVTQK